MEEIERCRVLLIFVGEDELRGQGVRLEQTAVRPTLPPA